MRCIIQKEPIQKRFVQKFVHATRKTSICSVYRDLFRGFESHYLHGTQTAANRGFHSEIKGLRLFFCRNFSKIKFFFAFLKSFL